MHPETFLRVLGPEPWGVVYVQPSRRPADGRFGENPNRLFKHHQFASSGATLDAPANHDSVPRSCQQRHSVLLKS